MKSLTNLVIQPNWSVVMINSTINEGGENQKTSENTKNNNEVKFSLSEAQNFLTKTYTFRVQGWVMAVLAAFLLILILD
jgi:hypothetical protein